jgi:hypothetical protein
VRGHARGLAGALPVGSLPRHARARTGAEPFTLRPRPADLAPDAPAADAVAGTGVRAARALPGRRLSRAPPAAGRAPGRFIRPVPGVPRRLADRLGDRPRPAAPRRRRPAAPRSRPALAGAIVARGARERAADAARDRPRHDPRNLRREDPGRGAAVRPLAAPRGAVRDVGPAIPDPAGDRRALAPHAGAAGRAEPLPVLLGRHHRGTRTAESRAQAPAGARRRRPGHAADRGTARTQPSAAGELGTPGARFRAHAGRIRQRSWPPRDRRHRQAARRPVLRRRRRDPAAAGAGRGARPASAERTPARAAAARGPLDRVPHHP